MSNTIISLSDNLPGIIDDIGSYENQLKLFSFRKQNVGSLSADIWLKRYQASNSIILEPFVNAYTPIKTKCLRCKIVNIRYPQHVIRSKCRNCLGIHQYTHEKVNNRLLESSYGLKLAEKFKGNVLLKHLIVYKCGCINQASLDSVFRGSNCSNCSRSGFNPSKPGIIYYVHFKNQNLWKIGITNRTLQRRFSEEINYDEIPIFVWSGKGSKCLQLEKIVKASYKALLYDGKWSKDDCKATEIFTQDISKLFSFGLIHSLANRFDLKLL